MKNRHKRNTAVIVLFVGCVAVIAVLAYFRYTSRQDYGVPACGKDSFLCDAIARLSPDIFDVAITGSTIESYNGSNQVRQIWERDEEGNYRYTSMSGGRVTDQAVHVAGRHFNAVGGKSGSWTESTSSDISNEADMAEYLSLDEIFGQFYLTSEKRKKYRFIRVGEQACGRIRCVKYQALYYGGVPVHRTEYLYFAKHGSRLVVYEEVAPEYRAVHTFTYEKNPPITPPPHSP